MRGKHKENEMILKRIRRREKRRKQERGDDPTEE